MCRSQNSGETPRRCPCTSPNKRSAYERAFRAAKRAASAIPMENIGIALEVEEAEEVELSYIEEAAELSRIVAGMYLDPNKKRLRLWSGEDPEKIEAVASEFPIDEDTYDDPEVRDERLNSVIRLGHLVANRAEEIAGISIEKILDNELTYYYSDIALYDDALEAHKAAKEEVAAHFYARPEYAKAHTAEELNEYDDAEDEMRTNVLALEKKRDELSEKIHPITHHLRTERELDRLSDAYIAALSEIRPMGGKMEWYNKDDNSPVVRMFNKASQVFPSEWIDYSNAQRLPFARNLSQRAHYSHHSSKKTNVYVETSYMTQIPKGESPPADTDAKTYTLATTEEASNSFDARDDYDVWKVRNWELPTRNAKRGKDNKPVGARWESYSFEGDAEKGIPTRWRRPDRYKDEDASVEESVPEILTKLLDSEYKRFSGYSTAAHELAHRFEHTVPEISRMEDDFFSYRTTNPDTGQPNPRFSLYGQNSGEYAREGNFISKYMGKEYVYGGVSHELLSTGVQGLFGHDFGGFIGIGKTPKDDHMRAFLLGVMASAGKRYL